MLFRPTEYQRLRVSLSVPQCLSGNPHPLCLSRQRPIFDSDTDDYIPAFSYRGVLARTQSTRRKQPPRVQRGVFGVGRSPEKECGLIASSARSQRCCNTHVCNTSRRQSDWSDQAILFFAPNTPPPRSNTLHTQKPAIYRCNTINSKIISTP